MKKKIITLLLATCMVGTLLSGCGKKTEDKNVVSNENEQTESTKTNNENALYIPDLGEVKVELADYTKVDFSNVEKIEVTDDDIQLQIASILDYYAEATYLDEGVVEDGSIVYISFNGFIDGELVEDASSEGYELTIGSGEMIDGFEDGLIGSNVGDTIELDLTFPEDYYNAEYQGKEIKFDITILNLVSYEAAEWNDDFVVKNLEFSSAKEYEDYLREDMANYYDGDYIQSVNDIVIQYLIDNSTVENIPEDEIQSYYDDGVAYYQEVATNYGYEYEDFVINYMGYETLDAFEEEFKTSAIEDLKYKYIMLAVAKDKGYVLTQEIYDNFIAQMATYYGSTIEEMTNSLIDEDMVGTYESALCNYTISNILDELGVNASEYTQRMSDAAVANE